MIIQCSTKRAAVSKERKAHYDFRKVLKKLNVEKKSELTRYRRPEAYEDIVRTHYVYRKQPVILREQIHTTIRHVIQPVLEAEDVTERQGTSRVQEYRPVRYDEYLHDISEEHKQKIADNRLRVSEAGSRVEMPDTHEEIFEEPQIHENVVKRVKEEVQPVLRRNVKKTRVMEEIVPSVEIHERVTAVEDIRENDPITFKEYLKWSEKK